MSKLLKADELILLENAPPSSSDTKYCFTWSSFKNHVMEEVGELLREEKFVDVTLLCDHHIFRAHRVILCSASPLLRQLLEFNPCPDPCISLSDVPWTHLTWVLQYIYSGQVAVPEEKFQEFLSTAKLLQITTLFNKEKDLARPAKQTPSLVEGSPAKKMRVSKRIAQRRDNKPVIVGTDGEMPIIISTESVSGAETDAAGNQNSEVFYRTQAVMQEMLKDGSQVEQNQEIITIQTSSVDDMQVEEIVEVVTSMTGDPLLESTEPTEIVTGELIDIQDSQEATTMKFLYTPNRNLKPTHSLAPKTCTLCGKVYSNLSNLRQHMNLVHTSRSTIPCPLCGKDFKSELYMRRHLICAHNVTPVKKDSQTKESRRIMNLKASPLKRAATEMEQEQHELWSEMDAAVENLTEQNLAAQSAESSS